MELGTTLLRGRLASVNVGLPRVLHDDRGRPWTTAIRKSPVRGRVAVRGVNVDGDDQADRRVHGGPDKAVYAYASEDAAWWAAGLGRALPPGALGENLTVDGLRVSTAVVGERWRVGSALLEVSQPRIPCAKLGVALGDPDLPRRFAAAHRPGAYLRIIEPGEIGAGDVVEVVAVPDHGLTVADVARTFHHRDPVGAARMLEAPALASQWHAWARERLGR